MLETLAAFTLLAQVSLSVFVVIFARYALHTYRTRRAMKNIPGPPSASLIWGQSKELYFSTPGSHWSRWHSKYGRVLKFDAAFGHQHLSITDQKAIAYILGSGAYALPKPSGVRAWFEATIGKGVVWTEEKHAHEQQKRALAPAFGPASVRKLTPIFYETANILVSEWSKILDSSQDGQQATIDATLWAGRFAVDSIGHCAFSHPISSLTVSPHPIFDSLDGLTNTEAHLASFYMRALFWIFPSILSIGKKGEMIKTSKKELGDLAGRIWQDVKRTGVDGEEAGSLLEMIFSADKDGLDDNLVIDQMRTIISAAYETVSSVISWALFELATNSQLQTRLRSELRNAHEPSYDSIHTFLLLDAFLKETLRMHPPILENHHQASEDILLPLSEPLPGSTSPYVMVPKDTILAIPLNVVHQDPAVWGPDAHVFNPNRWLSETEEKNKLTASFADLLVFSNGPRKCLGHGFALAEIKVLLVTVLQHFRLECHHDIEAFQAFVIRPRVVGEGHSSLPILVHRL